MLDLKFELQIHPNGSIMNEPSSENAHAALLFILKQFYHGKAFSEVIVSIDSSAVVQRKEYYHQLVM
jgi:hypothetical protein